jgi:antitoxin HicB
MTLAEIFGGGFLAIAPDLPGCMSDGWTQREALANLHDAIAEWIADAREMGRSVPEPKYFMAAYGQHDSSSSPGTSR